VPAFEASPLWANSSSAAWTELSSSPSVVDSEAADTGPSRRSWSKIRSREGDASERKQRARLRQDEIAHAVQGRPFGSPIVHGVEATARPAATLHD
jgi:hypothetical protein